MFLNKVFFSEAELGECCGEGSTVITSTRVEITILDENTNAPNFELYFGEDFPQNMEDIFSQNDEIGTTRELARIRDRDTEEVNTKTCFFIIDDENNSSG